MNPEEFINAVNVASFLISIMNYQENLTQSDKSEILQNSQNVSDKIINEINEHLQLQDKKIDFIIQELEKLNKENLRNN